MEENKEILRKEVRLRKDVVERLEALAARKLWSVKKYMEFVLNKEAEKFKPLSDGKEVR